MLGSPNDSPSNDLLSSLSSKLGSGSDEENLDLYPIHLLDSNYDYKKKKVESIKNDNNILNNDKNNKNNETNDYLLTMYDDPINDYEPTYAFNSNNIIDVGQQKHKQYKITFFVSCKCEFVIKIIYLL